MESVTNCPHCGILLSVPDRKGVAEAASQAQCPACLELFAFPSEPLTAIAELILVEKRPVERPSEDQATQATVGFQPDIFKSSTARTDTARTNFEIPRPLEAQGPNDLPEQQEETGSLADSIRTDSTKIDALLSELEKPSIGGKGALEKTLIPEASKTERAPQDNFSMVAPNIKEPLKDSAKKPLADSMVDDSMVNLAPFAITSKAVRRRSSSTSRTLASIAGGGLGGLAIAYYALLWIVGPGADGLELASYLPARWLPGSFQSLHETSERQPAILAQQGDRTNSAEVPASFVTPSESLRKTKEPANFQALSAEPLPRDVMEEIEVPTFSADRLAQALRGAELAQVGLLGGKLSDSAFRRKKGLSYARLCELAYVLTYFRDSSPAIETRLRLEARDLFQKTLTKASIRAEVAQVASIWIDSPHRRHGGVFLAGRAEPLQKRGEMFEYNLDSGVGSPIRVLVSEPLNISQQPVGVVGTILENPQQQVPGYRGNASRIIWACCTFPLEEGH